MMRVVGALLFLVALSHGAHVDSVRGSASVSPVQKVIELLDDLRGKVEKDTAAEETAMTEYLEYCDMEAKDTQFAITTGEREMEDLGATISDCESRVTEYEEEISSISSTIAAKEQEIAEAADVRKMEHGDFAEAEKDLLDTIDEMSRAQMTIKKERAFVQLRGASSQPSKKMLAIVATLSKMVDAQWLDVGSKKRITKFLQAQSGASDGDTFSLRATEKMMQPQAKTDNYESHSNGILDTVTDMEEKAQQSLSDARKKEMKAAHSYAMTRMSLQDNVKLLKSKLSEATQSKSATTEEAGKAKGNMAGFAKSLQADKNYLVSLNTECESKNSEWQSRQESAKGELEAISKAKEILSSGVKAAFVQQSKQPLFESSRKAAKRARLTDILRNLAKKFHSYALMEMANRAQADPFAKVKGLIEDMVTKLLNQANEEASHKAFCDEELSSSKKSQDDKMASMDDFQSRMDSASTNRKELDEQIKVLQKEVADIDVAQKEAAKVREEEKANFLQTVGDYRASAEAVAQAIQVLKNYYNGESSLIQKSEKAGVTAAKQPAFGEKKSDSAGSIISVLEMSEADFTKLVAEAETQENESVEAFRKLKEEDELAKVAKLSAVTGKTSEMKSLAVALDHYKEDHAAASKELDAVMDYLDKLKPQCETKVMSYEERKARREAEIEGLKEALAIFDGTSIPVL